MIHRRTFVFALLALSVGVACGKSEPVSAARPPGPIARDLASLVLGAPLIIVGEVVKLQPGRIAGKEEARLQFNDVHVRVERRLKGEPPDVVVVEQIAIGGHTFISEVGPPYRPAERYVFFLHPGDGTRYITTSQGRFLLKAGRVRPTDPGPVADAFKGKDEAKFIAEVQAIVAGQP